MTFGFSAQSAKPVTLTLGLEVIKFILPSRTRPTCAHRPALDRQVDLARLPVLTLVAMMMDYMLPKRTMSWKEPGRFASSRTAARCSKDLARYGIKMPGLRRQIALERTTSRTRPGHLLQLEPRRHQFPHLDAGRRRNGLAVGEVPDNTTSTTVPRGVLARKAAKGNRFYNKTLPMLCQTCPDPAGVHQAGTRPDLLPRSGLQGRQIPLPAPDHCKRSSRMKPEIRQAWLPVPRSTRATASRRYRPDGGRLRPAGCRAEITTTSKIRSATASISTFRKTEKLRQMARIRRPRTSDAGHRGLRLPARGQ